jgi:hypothetical protein
MDTKANLNRFDHALRGMGRMPEYFSQYGPREPQPGSPVPLAFALDQTDKSLWEIVNLDGNDPRPASLKMYGMGMAVVDRYLSTAGLYDFSRLVDEAKKSQDRIVLVDVRGGLGRALKSILHDFPGLPIERCVLQDRPEMIERRKSMADDSLSGVQLRNIDIIKDESVEGGARQDP